MQSAAKGDMSPPFQNLHLSGWKRNSAPIFLMRTTLVFLLAVPLWAQDALSLREAVRLAIRENASVAGTTAKARASETRITQAHAGMLPKINYSESFERSDNPVFVFSSLLTQ